jgi:hypothetical protein
LVYTISYLTSPTQETQVSSSQSRLETRYISNYKFVGFLGKSILLRRNDQIYKYTFDSNRFTPFTQLEPNERIISGGQYYALYKEPHISSKHNLYKYTSEIEIFKSDKSLVEKLSEIKFSIAQIYSNKLFLIKYREINNLNENISKVKGYKLSATRVELDTVMELPLEVIHSLEYSNTFETIPPRIPTAYYIQRDGNFKQLEYHSDYLVMNNNLCNINKKDNDIKCPDKKITFDPNTLKMTQYNNKVYALKISDQEHSLKQEDSVTYISTSLPFSIKSDGSFVCNQYYCALSGQNKTILFNINNTTNT